MRGPEGRESNIGALIIRMRFWGPVYYIYNKEPSRLVWAIIEAPILRVSCGFRAPTSVRLTCCTLLCSSFVRFILPRGSYPTPFLGYLVLWLGSVI